LAFRCNLAAMSSTLIRAAVRSGLRPAHFFNGGKDAVVRAAATDVAAHALAHGHACGTALAQQPCGRHDLSRRAVAALEAVVLDEGRLQRMQLVAARQALDGRDLRAVV